MMFFRALLLVGAACILACRGEQPRVDADTVFVGRIVTLDEDRPEAEAVAVHEGRIVAIGSAGEVAAAVRPGTRHVTLPGVALPGFADSHVHALALGGQLEVLELRGLSKAAILDLVANRVQMQRGSPAWIEGRGWDEGFWMPPAYPTAADLDRVSPERPVLLTRIDGHSIWINSAAMRLAGITRRTLDPEGGRLIRLPDGSPSGMLVDAAVDLVTKIVPALTPDLRRARLEAALTQYVRWGLTSVHDAGVDLEGIALYKALAADHRLPLRVYVMARSSGETASRLLAAPPEPPIDNGRLSIRSVKVLLDGALGSRGAELLEPYSDAPRERGLVLMKDVDLGSLVDQAVAHGWQVNAHAIGDRAVRRALDVFESHGGRDLARLRFRVEHASVVDDADLPRFARLGVIASMQPVFVGEYSRWAGDRLGPDRVRRVLPVQRLLANGATIAAGTDYPDSDSGNPLVTLYCMVTRRGANGDPAGGWYPGDRVDIATAIRAMTVVPAFAAFQEQELGALTKGRFADMTVLSADPRTTPPERLKELRVLMTIVGGAPVYDAERPLKPRAPA